jgi:hypothetical protein
MLRYKRQRKLLHNNCGMSVAYSVGLLRQAITYVCIDRVAFRKKVYRSIDEMHGSAIITRRGQCDVMTSRYGRVGVEYRGENRR